MKEKATRTFTDEELVQMIQGKEEDRHQALRYFFLDTSLERMVFSKIRERGGPTQDAQDAYQEAFKVFQRNVRNNDFEGRSALRSYFVGIAIKVWEDMNKRSWNRRTNLTDDHSKMDSTSDDTPLIQTEAVERKTLVRQLLDQMGERCKSILWLRANAHSMEEIAIKIGLSSAEMAKKEAYRCNNRLREMVLSKPELVHLVKSMIYE